jgi:D-alanyl-D-alanine carboxypeptidase (penicillin-binding protein 5/6)
VGKRLEKIKQTGLIVFMIVFVTCSTFMPFADPVKAANETDLNLGVKAAILMEADTGQVLYTQNADELLMPASMAKMMVEYIALENVSSGKLKWEDMVSTSKYASEVIGSGQLLANGEKMSLKDMFYALTIYSSNDAAVAIAEHIAGSEENFAKQMNDKAKQLGLSDGAHFINVTGLTRADMGNAAPADLPGETELTARDTATLAFHLIQDHKEILEFTKIPSKKLRPSDKSPMINWDWMLEGNKDVVNFRKFAYTGLDGLKTGHTDEAGYCFTGTAERDGMRLISVVMGAPGPVRDKSFVETGRLLDYGFNTFEKKTIVHPKMEVESLKTVPIRRGTELEVPVVTDGSMLFVVPKGTTDDQFQFTAEPVDEEQRVAPIKQGDIMGKLTVTLGDTTQQVNLVAAADVEEAGWFRLFMRAVKGFFGDTFSGIKDIF